MRGVLPHAVKNQHVRFHLRKAIKQSCVVSNTHFCTASGKETGKHAKPVKEMIINVVSAELGRVTRATSATLGGSKIQQCFFITCMKNTNFTFCLWLCNYNLNVIINLLPYSTITSVHSVRPLKSTLCDNRTIRHISKRQISHRE